MTEASPARKAEQARAALGLADAVSALRLPLAVLFIVCPSTPQRLSILAAAAVTDLLDGWIARWLGPSRLGAFVDALALSPAAARPAAKPRATVSRRRKP